MKLKYYLRGLGMGIIFATLVLTISSVIHNNNLSEEKIIKEAQKLGMIMPDETETENGNLWNKKESVDATESEDTSIIEETSKPEEETESADTEIQTEEASEEKQPQKDGEQIKGENGMTYIVINIYPGDAARQIAERLYENKLVDDAENFRKYLGQTGQANRLSVGEYMVPVGATYEQIFDVLMRR